MCSRGLKQNIQPQNTYHSLCHHWVSPCSNISSTWTMISCCGLACDESLSIDISTLSRKLTYESSVPWSLHASMAGFSPSTSVFIIDLRSKDSMKCSTPTHSFTSHGLCWVLWEPLTLLVVSLMLVNSLHHWLVIKWFLPCSTSTHLFTWLESYQFGK